MNARRSERLRRKRQTTPGVSQPGAYSPYNDGYVVESEASFLPPTERGTKGVSPNNMPNDSRRARYAASPHRYTMEESPVPMEANDDEDEQTDASPIADETDWTNTSPGMPSQRTPAHALRRARREDIVERVRTSLFDILGSATRRSVNPHWQPVGGRKTGPGVGAPTLPPRMPLSVQPGTRHRVGNRGDTVPSDGEGDDAILPKTPVRVRWQRYNMPPLLVLLLAFLLSIIVMLALDSEVSSRRGGRSAWRRIEGVVGPRMPTMPDVPNALQVISKDSFAQFADRVWNACRYAASVLFRNAWRSTPGHVPADVLTRSEFQAVFMPEILSAARKAATEEAERATKEVQSMFTSAATAKPETTAVSDDESFGMDEFARFAERYAADKDLPADFALASAGGAVVATEPSAIALWARFARAYAVALVTERTFTPTRPRSPSVVLAPDVLPGNCWSFDSTRGSITIRLARPVSISAVSIEHTPRRSVFSVASAMRDFRIVGRPLNDEEADIMLGEYIFDLHDDSARHLQTFNVQCSEKIMRAVRVEILSNHGANYTAVYRIRVHGDEFVQALDGLDKEL